MKNNLEITCLDCGWVHFAYETDEDIRTKCFRCAGTSFRLAEDNDAPAGVTIQGIKLPDSLK